MKLKLSQIISSQHALIRLASERFPANIAYRIQRNMRLLDAEREAGEKTMIDLIMNKYGGKETSKGMFEAAEEHKEAATKELNELRNETIEIDIRKLPLDSVREIAPFDLMALDWMFEEPEDEKTPVDSKVKTPRKRK